MESGENVSEGGKGGEEDSKNLSEGGEEVEEAGEIFVRGRGGNG